MNIPNDKDLKQYIRDRQKALGLSTAEIERRSKFYGLGPYLAGKLKKNGEPRSIGVDNACKVAAVLEVE